MRENLYRGKSKFDKTWVYGAYCPYNWDMMGNRYVYGYEYKKPPITEEVIYCRECRKHLTSECPLCFIEKQTLQFIDMRNNFFCGYAERKENDNGKA